ncbi:Calcium-independent phospholipase A2-gamma [Halotydeus destructor]|nr:Calcium-independent phospholipase A2-gamma [Halotydeus destructor]
MMKSMKVFPSALSSVSYYFKEVINKLSPNDRKALVNSLKEQLDTLGSKETSKPIRLAASPIHNVREDLSANLAAVSSPKIVANRTENDVEDHQLSLFESQMTDWMKDTSRGREVNEAAQSLADMSVDSLEPENPSNPDNETKKALLSAVMMPKLTRSAINTRTKQIVKALLNSEHPTGQAIRVQELSKHLMLHPDAVSLAVGNGAVPILLRLRDTVNDRAVISLSRQALSLLGFVDPPKGKGIRILSIDGGGMRGIIIVEILRQIESLTGSPIHKSFDLICGVSTGAIVTMLIGALRTDMDQCEQLYRFTSKNLFKSDFWRGTSRLLLTHAYYDSAVWEGILRKTYGEKSLIETTMHDDAPKLMAISASMTSPKMKPYVFRNYNLPEKAYGYYDGSSKHKVWQAVRASSSAPGYFEEYVLDNHVHQDGGILINNPASIAIHEAKLLWPNEPIQSCISIGTGRYTPASTLAEAAAGPTSLRAKITSFIDSATDTETVHRLLQDLLPKHSYHRINPTISEWLSLDETREEKIDQLKTDGQMYMRRNEFKMKRAAETLGFERTYYQKAVDNIRYQYSLRK